MESIKQLLTNLIGEYVPNTATNGFFAGADAQWIMSSIVFIVCLCGFFGLLRAMFRR